MRSIKPVIFALLASAGLLAADWTTADAAGAIAIGRCDRVGYSYDFGSESGAHARALAECRSKGDGSCEVVVTLHAACGAFAVSGCEARGWAYAGTRRQAERIALSYCRKNGGEDCEIQAWVCDSGP
jgi:Domain of unknown function (DUF4189)